MLIRNRRLVFFCSHAVKASLWERPILLLNVRVAVKSPAQEVNRIDLLELVEDAHRKADKALGLVRGVARAARRCWCWRGRVRRCR